jgi:hypothetical protein
VRVGSDADHVLVGWSFTRGADPPDAADRPDIADRPENCMALMSVR